MFNVLGIDLIILLLSIIKSMVLGSNLKVKYVDFYHVFKFYNCLILEFSTLLIS